MPDPVEVFAVPLGPLQANCFIVVQGENGLVVDPGDEADVVIQAFTEFGFAPAAVLVTHGHFDHFGGVMPVARHFDIPVYVGAEDAGQMADGGLGSMAGFDIEPVESAKTIEGEQTLDLPISVLAIPTPGHSRGSYTFAIGEGELFVGDLIFQGSVGRTGPARRRHGPVAQLRRHAHPPVPAGRHRALRPRAGHVAGPGARAQPVPLAHPSRPGAPLVSSPRAPKGTYDLLPDDAAERDAVVAAAARVFAAYGYRHVVTPEFEETGLFERGVGEATDIVRKEMYTFLDKGDRSLTLRPEGTAPICRMYVEHGMHKLPQPVKLWYYCPMFRYEKPQAGRYREHYQIGAEAIGSEDPAVDAEVVLLLAAIFEEVGVEGVTLNMNSMGDKACRPAYVEKLREYLRGHERELCGDCLERVDVNPLRTFDCKVETCRAVLDEAPRISDHLCPECREHFDRVLVLVRAAGLEPNLDFRLVRGLDYYTRTTFEFNSDRLGAQSGVGGGGRYDGLVEQIGGQATPGVGWGSGLERIALAMREPLAVPHSTGVYVVAFSDDVRAAAFACAQTAPPLRCAGRGGPRRAQPQGPAQAGRPQRSPFRRAARPRRARRRPGAAQGSCRRRGRGRRRRRPRGPDRRPGGSRVRPRSRSTLRDSYPAASFAPPTSAARSASPAGWRAAATTAASSSSTCATAAAWSSWSSTPSTPLRRTGSPSRSGPSSCSP